MHAATKLRPASGIARRALGLTALVVMNAVCSSAALADEVCYIPLSGSAAQYGYSQMGPFNRATCEAARQANNLSAPCQCTYTAPPQTYSPRPAPVVPSGPSPEEIARRKREADAETARQAALAKQQAEAAAAAQRRYQQERDAAPIKNGGIGTSLFGVTPKGEAPPSAVIRDLKPATAVRDLSGKEAQWKRLNCAASITGDAVNALQQAKPDFDEFAYLAGQASSALSGDTLGVVCDAPPAMPKFNTAQDVMRQRMEALIARSRNDADTLKAAQAQRKAALDQLIDAKKRLAELQGGGDAAQKEIVALQTERQALGSLTLKPAPAPPAPGETKPKPPKREAGKPCPECEAAVAEARRLAAEAERKNKEAVEREVATKADLDRVNTAVGALEKGEAQADGLLAAFDKPK